MYLEHFGLREPPFGITPDTAFAFGCASHQSALNVALVALSQGEGFIKITGEVGTGKTLLCRRLLATFGRDTVTAYLPNPLLEPHGLLDALGHEFEIALDPQADEHHQLRALNHGLLHFARAGRRPIVLIDEAQAMPLPTLEALRLLSNLETEKRKLLQVVLFGQPELDRRLADPSVRQLRSRITFEHRLTGLSRSELRHYLGHRLRVAGYVGATVFGGAAVWALHRASGGIPRLVNVLAHKCLMLVYGEGGHRVQWRHVRAAIRDTGSVRRGRLPWLVWALAAAPLAGAAIDAARHGGGGA
ncbi:MAG: AAA family ATPase [Burkholderiales bacterium]|jgi:MSHA biogenesis protein MshM|nr:AAA family ATPase [Burkholderiales bacterium]